jgi:hypothetical protein
MSITMKNYVIWKKLAAELLSEIGNWMTSCARDDTNLIRSNERESCRRSMMSEKGVPGVFDRRSSATGPASLLSGKTELSCDPLSVGNSFGIR